MFRNTKNSIVKLNLHHNKEIISVPDVITIRVQDNCIVMTGTLGTLTHVLHKSFFAKLNDKKDLLVYPKKGFFDIKGKSLIGTTRALIKGMITGVTVGFVKKLQLVGIGYRALLTDNVISLTIGFSHSINYTLPINITAECSNQNEIILMGTNKQLIGQVAADLRALRPPEPFKGKGIRYSDETVYIKDAKKR